MYAHRFIVSDSLFNTQAKAEVLEQGNPFKQIQYTEQEYHVDFQTEWNQLLASRKKFIYNEFQGKLDISKKIDTKIQSYSELRPLYLAKGIYNPAKYLIDNISGIEFFGHKTIGHIELRDRLKVAEKILKRQNRRPMISSFWSFAPRKIRGSKNLSKHALGRAVDINPDTNPRIINKDEIKIIHAVTGVNLGQIQTASAMRQASLVFRSKFTPQWIKMQKIELQKSISRSKSALNRYAKTGFINLEQPLIDALKAAGIKWGGNYINSKDFMHFELKTYT